MPGVKGQNISHSFGFRTSESLMHHGIKGMHWGVRRYQNPDGSLTPEGYARYAKKNLKRAKIRNLDKWGTDEDHNVLYVIGNSGSGKSTTARGMAKEGDEIIHLDVFLEKVSPEDKYFNKDFDDFCRRKGVDVDTVRNGDYTMGERIKAIDAMAEQVEPYGKYCFKKGKRVVIEGVQMADDTMFPDKTYFTDKPTVTLKTNYIKNTWRAYRRDNNTVVDTVKTMLDPERKKWYDLINKHMNEINNLSHSFGFRTSESLMHHGIKGQEWGVRNGPPYPLQRPSTDISDENYAKIEELYQSMSLQDRSWIDPDNPEKPYFSSKKNYYESVAFNAVSKHGFIVAEKIPEDQNVDQTHGVEVGIGVTKKGKGVGSGLTKDLTDWFDSQDYYDVIWWPVDERNGASIRIAEKNGFIKDPLGDNYIYAKDSAYKKLGIESS